MKWSLQFASGRKLACIMVEGHGGDLVPVTAYLPWLDVQALVNMHNADIRLLQQPKENGK